MIELGKGWCRWKWSKPRPGRWHYIPKGLERIGPHETACKKEIPLGVHIEQPEEGAREARVGEVCAECLRRVKNGRV